MTEFKLSGTWSDNEAQVLQAFFADAKDRPFTYRPGNKRLFGVDFYPVEFTTRVKVDEAVDGDDVNMTLTPTQHVVRRKAEWWRRMGYRILSLDFHCYG